MIVWLGLRGCGARVPMVPTPPAGSAPSDCVVPHSRLVVARARLPLSVRPRQPGRPGSSTPFLRIDPGVAREGATADRHVAGELDERAFEPETAPPARASPMASAAIAEAGAPLPGSHRQLLRWQEGRGASPGRPRFFPPFQLSGHSLVAPFYSETSRGSPR
jgi:hypothetical protein